jgi:glycerophosphoryl diester phosphodiesterase
MPNYIQKTTLKEGKFSIKFSGKTDEVIAQLLAITNEKGYFNLEIKKRKEAGKYGDTHYLQVDEWKPAEKKEAPVGNPNNPDDFPF